VISLIGRTLVLAALGACAVGAVSGFVGGARRDADALRITRFMANAFGALMVAATLLMEWALVTHDFSVSYVAAVGSLSTPLHITLVSLWSSLNGSILFWGCVLGGGTLAFTRHVKEHDPQHASYALGSLLSVGLFFAFLVAGIANPFAPTEGLIPTDGPGPNPLLQNHLLMIIHPPSLYLGYVLMAVPYAMAAAALLAGRLEATWMRLLRRWMLFAWAFLSLGILLGGWWSYEVLGWGGYWAWDPVENASFMPWLTATAFLHSAMVMERQGQLKGWTLTLAMSTFLLTLLGTFMTRSGVFNSVHSFTQSSIGPVFLGFIALVLIASVVLLAARLDALTANDKATEDGVVSRESAFLLNNLLFVAFTFTVLLGTLFPLIKEALTEERISVGEPYFNRMSLPVCVGILFLMGVGPSLPWGNTSGARAWSRLRLPLRAAAAGAVLGAVLQAGPWAIATFAGAAFALVVTVHELLEPAQARVSSLGESLPKAFLAYAARARQRVGGYIVHLGVIICAVSIAASSTFKVQRDLPLAVGQEVAFEGYRLRFEGMRTETEPHRTAQVATVAILGPSGTLGVLEPKMNHYKQMREPIGTPAVRSGLKEDLYLSLVRVSADGATASVRAMVEPMVAWLWFGGLVMFGGALFSLWPRGRAVVASPSAAPVDATVDAAARPAK